jgi:hypothetical protein
MKCWTFSDSHRMGSGYWTAENPFRRPIDPGVGDSAKRRNATYGLREEMALRNFLLVYNWRESKLDHWRDLDREVQQQSLTPGKARQLYADYERRFTQQDGYEVVLLGADSLETIRRTHGHYFGGDPLDQFSELL